MSTNAAFFLEYLNDKGDMSTLSFWTKQIPRVIPIDADVQFMFPDNKYAVLKQKSIRYRPRGDYFSVSITPGAVLPLPDQTLLPSATGTVNLNYNVNLNYSGIIGVGIHTGINWLSIPGENQFDLITIPLALNINYVTNFSIPLFFRGEVNLGIGLQTFQFPDGFTGDDDKMNLSFYCVPGIEFGYNLSATFSIAAGTDLYFFKDTILFMPGLCVTLNTN